MIKVLASIKRSLATGQDVIYELIDIDGSYYESRVMYRHPVTWYPLLVKIEELDYPAVNAAYGVDLNGTQ